MPSHSTRWEKFWANFLSFYFTLATQNPSKVVNHDECREGIWWNELSSFKPQKGNISNKKLHILEKWKNTTAVAHFGEMRTYLKSHQVLRERVHFHIFARKSENWFYFTSLQISFTEHRHIIISTARCSRRSNGLRCIQSNPIPSRPEIALTVMNCSM